MNETYYEIMIEKKKSPVMKFAGIATAVMAVIFLIISVLGILWGLLLAIVSGMA